MDCNKASELISLSIDQMLSDEEQIELQQHMATCEDCKEEYDLFQSIQSALSSEEAASLPENFHNDLMERIEKEEISHSNDDKVIPLRKPLYKRFDYKRFNVAAAIVVVLIFGIIGVSNLNNMYNSSDEAVMEMSTGTADMKKSAPVEEKMEMKADQPELVASDMQEKAAPRKTAEVTTEEAVMETVEVMDVMEAESIEVTEEASEFGIASDEVSVDVETTTVSVLTEQPVAVNFSETMDDSVAESSMQRDDANNQKSLKGTDEPPSEESVEEASNQPLILASIIFGIMALITGGAFLYRKIR